MSTTHKLTVDASNVVRTPSKQAIRKKIAKSHTLPGFQIKPGYLYTVVRAISARVNQNFDGWPSNELREAAHTFVGKPVFVNHHNYDPKQARGVVVASRYIENGIDKYIEVVQEIDARRFPKLAQEIKSGGLDSVSMGAEAGFTICSACGNKASDVDEMCYHVLFKKGEKVNVRNKKTGKVEQRLVYESCHKLSFFELSYVFDPADETAVASKVIVANRKTAGTCGPGDNDCAVTVPGDLPSTAYPSGGGGGGGAGSSAGMNPDLGKTPSAGGKPGADGIMDSSRGLYDSILEAHPDLDIGGYREDSYGEHANGALDVMTSDPAIAESVKQKAFDAGAPYVLWNQTQWNADGTSSPMEDRGSPTENHMDHVHTAPLGKTSSKKLRWELARMGMKVKTADATDDYLEWQKKVENGEVEPERGPKGAMPNKGLGDWAARSRKRTAAPLPPPENSQHTQRPGTYNTYSKAHDFFDQLGAPHDKGPEGVLDYGAGLGHSGEWGHTYEPHPRSGFEPTYKKADDVPEGAYHRVTNLNVLNVVPPEIRHQIVDGIGRAMAPGGHAIITTRGLNEVLKTKSAVPADNGDHGAVIVNPGTPRETYQKGFTPKELHQYVSDRLGPEYTVKPLKLGPAGVHIVRNGPGGQQMTALRNEIRAAIYKKAWGEVEAPQAVDTLRQEGSAPEDDNDDFHHYVDSPQELSMPDLSQANQLDRQQAAEEAAGVGGNPEALGNPNGGGVPGPAEGGPMADPDAGQYMTLKIPIPGAQAPGAPSPAVPMQSFAGRGAISGHMLAFFERYYGHRVANWQDAIVAGRDLTPEEKADFNREAALWTLENISAESGSSRNTMRGTANMARSTLASRRKTAGTRHFAEGPNTDGGPYGRQDQGEQEEAFITQTAPSEPVAMPDDDETNISNTEGNLVADAEYAKSLTAKLAQQKRELEATAREFARIHGKRITADEYAGGPTATEVNPTVPTSSAEELTGDDFTSADPNPAVDTSPGGPGTTSLPHESSLKTFQVFDKWLTASTGKSTRQHSEKNIRRAAKQFADYNGISVDRMFPALGVALRQARKIEAEKKKGQPVRKKAVDLETAAPDERVSVPAVVENITDEEAQQSQFDESGYANNAGDDLAKPDMSTGQNFAPGEAPNKQAKKADGILAIRCAEAMIAAGLEPNTRERKYQLAAEFQNMSRGLIADRTALAERFAMVRQADAQRVAQKVASGRTRGTASPVPPGIGQGGGGTSPRTASTRRLAENDPTNDSLLFG
ncbi:hypothetical protein SEA_SCOOBYDOOBYDOO_90 [Mycobacterium phage ScoobyDoobyDoo]|nr:hypothetical protein SEA_SCOOBYDOOBYDOO_90 [Mycobacterium phage ScoobyDoobyDoo]